MTVKERQKRLREANADALAERKGQDGINKRVTTFKGDTTALKDGETSTGGIEAGPMAPSDEQLAKINQFTRSNKTADDLVVFPTLSCNDLYDRDDEKFVTDTVKEFAALPDPYGPVGKSYMVSHDYTKLPVGRIFDVGVKSMTLTDTASKDAKGQQGELAAGNKATFLTNWVYMPKTDSNKQFIENLDFGINWAVSVGVMLNEAKCSLPWCGAPMNMSRFFGAWCQEGHDKGLFYTEDAARDDWGYYEPTDPADKSAVKCRTDLYGAKDFYELSQCFLGAQFFAALDGTKGATAKGIVKAASARSIPIIGLSREEASVIEDAMPHLPTKAVEGVRTYGAKPDEDGNLKWTDGDGLVWTFTPSEDSEVLCLGKSNDEDGEEDQDAEAEGATGVPGEGSSDDAVEPESADSSADDGEGDDAEDGGSGTGEESKVVGEDGSVDKASEGSHTHSHTHSSTGTTHSHSHSHSAGTGYQHTTSDNVTHSHGHDTSGKEATVSKAAVVRVLRTLALPETVLRSVEDAEGDSLDTALRPLVGKITELTGEVSTLTPKAALGDTYIQSKRAEALDWFVKANQTEPNSPVSTGVFEKLLNASGDNVELIDALIEQQKTLAQAKFPAAVRRSSFPVDANKSEPGDVPSLPDDGVDSATPRTVKRIHG